LNIVVCIKRVPQTADAQVRVDSSGKDIEKERLTFDLNESDAYALEQAVLFKEQSGGTITAVSVGHPDTEDTLRMVLAKGADTAIRIKAEDFDELDGYKTAQILKTVIEKAEFDMIFTGCMATDDGYYQVGVNLAQLLGIPHATLVSSIEIGDGAARIKRELEGGLLEHDEISLPALFSVQTGINVPRYASLIAIRKAAKKEIAAVGQDDIDKDALVLNTQIEELFVPPVTKRAEIFSGTPEEVSGKLADMLNEKGLI
jgi:electron transfer flavoprotein beta subunit